MPDFERIERTIRLWNVRDDVKETVKLKARFIHQDNVRFLIALVAFAVSACAILIVYINCRLG